MSHELSEESIEFFYESIDGEKIFAKHWPSKNEAVKGIIQIAHGLGETAHYYEEFSRNAVRSGFAVYIHEARGHGRTAGDVHSPEYPKKAGDVGVNGFVKMRDDMVVLTQIIKNEHPHVPVYILAHSMGSVIARLYSFTYGNEIDGFILTGAPSASSHTDALLAAVEQEIRENGLKAPCKDTFRVMFRDVNTQFEPVMTELDWITSDRAMIEASLKLPYTYVMFNNEFYKYFLLSLKEMEQERNINSIPKELPIYLLSGSKDSITENGSITETQCRLYKKAGIKDVRYKIYENKRHSILRETNRVEVTEDILHWIDVHIKKICNV